MRRVRAKGRKLRVRVSEEIEVSEMLERPSVVMALGAHDGKRRDVLRTRVPRCRVVDIGTCDSILTREQLAVIRRVFNVPSHKFVLPSLGHRIRTPPDGYFTVYAAYFDSGFSIPPHPLLVKVIKSYGICVSQLTPNSFMCFEGWRRRFRELGLPVTLASFHALWTVAGWPKFLVLPMMDGISTSAPKRRAGSWMGLLLPRVLGRRNFSM
ncbi:UNVERIFIED_CONTAM: hypothetical protein Sradi_3081800 [Sesamum radiatum]|uniref:Uncharacterized protein n=1 Tax=Sesamum radiatum TaxID=300843 RepID=A0AAW2REJ3_SESRA